MESAERIRMTRARSARRPSRQAGVTFIELMAVVLIIAILGLIALPSYRQYAIRAHRTEGKAALLAARDEPGAVLHTESPLLRRRERGRRLPDGNERERRLCDHRRDHERLDAGLHGHRDAQSQAAARMASIRPWIRTARRSG